MYYLTFKENTMKTTKKILAVLAILGVTSVFAGGADAYKRCAGCHGVNGEKKALGKSAAITGWDISKTVAALKGYKDGSYGGAMKGVMKGQVASLSDADIQALSEHISTLK